YFYNCQRVRLDVFRHSKKETMNKNILGTLGRFFATLLILLPVFSQGQIKITDKIKSKSRHFTITDKSSTATILYDASDSPLVKRSAALLADDIEKVSGKR